MQDDDLVRAVIAAVAFGVMLAGHYIGDHWVQTSEQAYGKGLDSENCVPRSAFRHCATHVASWTLTTTLFLLAAGWWLRLPFEPGWLIAGLTLNAVTHFIADLRTPLIRLGRLLGRGGYLDHVGVVRPNGPTASGPGTGLFELDQAWHIGWLAVSALVIAGPPL
ncbi:MAG TPA: transcriptional regulator [Actinoplanes sp.]|nr:transcriptional regulator [Actinoplanes sp.]